MSKKSNFSSFPYFSYRFRVPRRSLPLETDSASGIIRNTVGDEHARSAGFIVPRHFL